MYDKPIIFSPGPANISERVRKALLLPDICHRDQEFTEILNETRQLILNVCGVNRGYKSVIFTGSGTAAIESAITSLKGVVKNLLVISNGSYGSRALDIAITYGVSAKELKFPINRALDLELYKKAIEHPDISAVYIVHHETTTGLLNPLKEVARLAKLNDKYVIVDGISSIGGEELCLDWGIDMIIGSANKCIRGVPGLSFLVVADEFVKLIKNQKRESYYTDLLTHLQYEENGETPFTPAVQTFFALREALKEILEEGLHNRITHYRKISSQLRDGLEAIGLKLFLPRSISSNTMTTVYLPGGFTYEKLHAEMKKEGYIIYNSLGELKGKTFRLGIVGLLSSRDINGFLKVLGETVNNK
jgi:2-aminoethylphosphonate-pyruvate transaminase